MPRYLPIQFAAFITAALLLSSCEFDARRTGPMRDQPVSLDLGNTDHASVHLEMSAGELKLRGGAQKLVQGRFEYNVPEWEPKIDNSTSGTYTTVTIRQPSGIHARGHTQNLWDLELNDNVLLDFSLDCGAGQARLELGDSELRTVNVNMGAGEIQLDLRGHPKRDYDVHIAGGVGQATVWLPHDAGVEAQAHGGLGSINVSGLEKRGDYYANSLYGNAKVNVHLKVEGGIGEIKIIG